MHKNLQTEWQLSYIDIVKVTIIKELRENNQHSETAKSGQVTKAQ
jgi:hypothetical protein